MRRIPTGLRGLAVVMLLVAMACSAGRSEESVGTSSQAVTNPSTARVLSFEQPTVDWSATSLNLRQGNQFFDGQHSAQITVVSSGGKLNSVPLSTLGPISSTVTLEVRLPTYVASPNFQGQVALWLHSPTAGIQHQYFGPAQFSNAPTGVFRQVQFILPPAIVSALSTKNYNDLVASIELDFVPNPNSSVGFSDPFYIDRLDFGQGSGSSNGGAGGGGRGGSGGASGRGGGAGAGSGGTAGHGGNGGNGGGVGAGGIAGSGGAHGGAAGSAGAGGGSSAGAAGTAGSGTSGPCAFTAQSPGSSTDVAFAIKLPAGVRREDVGLSATGGSLTLADGVSVVRDGGGFASVSSVQATGGTNLGITNLGVAVQVQDAYTEPTGVDLRSNAHVHGSLKTAGNETTQTGVVVDGSNLQQTSLQPLESVTWSVSFPNTNHGSCSLEPDNTEIISPGSYGDIAVKSRSHLKVRSGTYYFNSLSFEPQSMLEIDNAVGPVFIYVRTSFAFGGIVAEANPTHMNFLFGVAGTSDVNIQSAFRGLLVAPFAAVSLPTSSDVGHVGSFFAKSILANANTVIHLRPFAPGELCASDAVCSSFCPCGPTGGTCGGTPSSKDPSAPDPNCIDGACCPAGASVVTLTSGSDTRNNATANACLLGLAGNDALSSNAPGATLVGGTGDDTITAAQFSPPAAGAPVRVFGGSGNDVISGWFDGAQIYGGPGNDVISAGPGGVLIAPGSGVDDASSGDGDDTFVLYSECEATPGKKLLANGGFDTLISPLSIDELRARGLIVEGFESVIIRSDACKSDCTPKPNCGAGSQCADRGGQAVCGASTSSSCQTCNDCASGLSCQGGTCQDPCVANPQAPGCAAGTPVHCTDGVHDGDETDIDCGGSCAACPTGGGCTTNADCGPDMVCGESNGACFGHTRAQRVCWKASCRLGTEAGGCGSPDSPCGQNCACVTGCDSTNPINTCPAGEACQARLGTLFKAPTSDVCLDPRCPSNDPSLCGSAGSVCGAECVCKADCSKATCQNPGDGCGGFCPGVCAHNQPGCDHDVACPTGDICMADASGIGTCRVRECGFRILAPPLCGTSGAICGDTCPACTPSCSNRQCGVEPNCGQSCGTCAAGAFCDFNGQCVTPTANTPIMVPDGNGGQKPLPDLPPSPTTPVGALKGQFSVTEQGSSQYTIPIEVPPGRAGMEPALSLTYAGSRMNENQGVGWHLEGLSKIARCPRSFALDGYSAPVQNDQSDHFCIDGKRLESVSGDYGADGSEYRTLIDSFAKVVSHVDAGSGFQLALWASVKMTPRSEQGPDYFQVFTKDGRILTFGHTQDSLVMARNGTRYAWLLNRVEDRAHNTMLVGYENLFASVSDELKSGFPNAVRPSVISYTGHGDTAGKRTVRFSYETRSDPQVTFLQGGVPSFAPDRLSRLTTYVNKEPVKNYKFQYGSGALSQIEKIFECAGGDDAVCKAPTTFEYTQESGFSAVNAGLLAPDLAAAGQLDLNGDGIPDFLETKIHVGDVDAKPALAVAEVSTDIAIGVASQALSPVGAIAVNVAWDVVKGPFWGLFGSDPVVTITHNVRIGTGQRDKPSQFVENVQGIHCDTNPTFVMDYDQDGKDDIVSACGLNNGSIFVGQSVGNGQFHSFPNGQAVLDATVGSPPPDPGSDLPVPAPEPAPILVDINGDGLQDVVTCPNQFTLDLWLRKGPAPGSEHQPFTQGFLSTPLHVFAPPQQLPGPDDLPPPPRPTLQLCETDRPTFHIFDIDGDGAPDLLVRGKTGWVRLRYTLSAGQASLSFQPVAFPDVGGDEDGSSGGGISLADFNGDGLADVWHARKEDKQVLVWINAGGGLFYASTVDRPRPAFDTDSRYRYRRTAVLDYNGDGRSDLLENWQFINDFGGEQVTNNANTGLLPDSVLSMFAPQNVPELKHAGITGQVFPSSFDLSADVDGDGNPDVFGDDGEVFYGSGARNTLLKRVVDGLGNVVTVAYDHSDTYRHDPQCTATAWPEKCLTTLTGLVSSHTEGFIRSSGEEVQERFYTYHYQNAHMSVAGHGWLGFDHRTVDASALDGAGSTTTIDYEPVARYDLSGKPTQSTTPPYLYPLAGLPRTTTVDMHVSAGLGAIKPALQSDFFDRRAQTINTWQVTLSASNRPFPSVLTRDSSTYDRPITGGGSIGPTLPPFADNGVLLTECFDRFGTDGYGNVVGDDKRCQLEETSLEETDTTTTFRPDASSWLISNPENITISSQRGTFAEREFSLTYTSDGLLATVVRAPHGGLDQRVNTTYNRDEFGNVTNVTEETAFGVARTTGITYDPDNVFPHTITNAAGQTTQVDFDSSWGEPKNVVDANGIAVQIVYDGFGKRTETIGPEGSSISTYATITVPNTVTAIAAIEPRIQVSVELQGTEATPGGASVTEFDNYGRVVRTTSNGFGGSKIIQEQAYDSLGRSLGRTLPHTAELTPVPFDRYSFDDLQRITRVTHSDGSFKEYQYASSASLDPSHAQWLNGIFCDGSQLCAVGFTQTIDEGGHKNATVTDYLGRVARNIDGDNIDTGAQTSNYVYGPFNQLAEARDNRNLLTRFEYDDYGRLLKHTDPDSGASAYSYNSFDELQSSTDPAQQLRTYQHDSLGRMTSVLDRDGTTQWIYDEGVNGLGRISDSISPATPEKPSGQHIHYSYEPPTPAGNRGLVQSVTYSIDGTDYPINLDYDDLGRTSRIHYPSQPGGEPIVAKYLYDSSGVLSGLDEVGSGTAKTLWRLNDVFQGHLVQNETFGNGAKTSYGYAPSRRFLENIQTTLGTEQIQSLEYTHFTNGQVHTLNAAGGVPLEYEYDNLNRLSSVNELSNLPTGTPYSYDDIGNLVGRGATVTTYQSGKPHLIDTVGDNTYLYDPNGNVALRSGPGIPGGGQLLSYTPFNLPRVISTAISDTQLRTSQFDYSADEERLVRRDVDSSTLHFVSDLYQRKFDTFATTLEERFRLYAGDRQIGEIVRKDGTDKTLFFHTDHLGSTDTISDSNGASFTQHFDPFGAPLSPPNPELTRVGFTGQDQDVDLGLTDMKGRIYDPLAGRFTSADPVMQAPFWSQGLNRYSYVFNDPINNTDPSGFDASGNIVGGAVITGDAVGVGLIYAGFGGTFGGALLSGLGSGANVGTSILGGLPGTAGSKGGTYSGVAPTAAQAATGAGRGSQQATGEIGPVGPPVHKPPSSCEVGICLAQSTAEAEGGPGYEVRSDGTGGGVPTWTKTILDDIIALAGGEIAGAINIVVTLEQHRQALINQMAAKEAPTAPYQASSANQMNKEVKRGQAPPEVKRVDAAHPPEDPQDHAHLGDGTRVRKDGTTNPVGKRISKSVIEWLRGHGWNY